MTRHSTKAKLWLLVTLLFAVAFTVTRGLTAPTPGEWLTLGVLVLAGAIAHMFPIRATVGAMYNISNAFIIAGALLLPPSLVSLFPLAVISPEAWLGRRNPGAAFRWVFNVGQTVVASHVAGLWGTWAAAQDLGQFGDLVALAGAALLFTFVQALMVGTMLSIENKTPVVNTGVLAPAALLGDSMIGLVGAAMGGLWEVRPMLLLLLPPVLIMAHRLAKGAHLAHLAEVDTKTGLHNFYHFERMLAEETDRSLRLRRPMAVLFADMDLLRTINNTHGHLAGDMVIRQVASRITATLRKGDLVARFGGEEFVALLPGTDAEEAMYLADEVRAAIAAHPFTLEDGTHVRSTISIGVATCPEDAANTQDLLKLADRAVYQAKQTRNTVVRAGATVVPRIASEVPGKLMPRTEQGASADRPWLATLMLWVVGLCALAVSLWSITWVYRSNAWLGLLLFSAIAAGAEHLKIPVFEANRQKITFSLGAPVSLAAITLYPGAAPLVGLAASAVQLFFILRQRKVDKIIFNLSNNLLGLAAAAGVYTLFQADAGFSLWHIVAAVISILVYEITSTVMVYLMISLHSRRPLRDVLQGASWYTPTKLFLCLTCSFFGGAYTTLGWIGGVMIGVPILLMWYTLDLYAKKSQQTIGILEAAKSEVEQAHRHQEETLRSLIETVASMIDARDKSVLGHSKQVAKYAVAIGRELGLNQAELAVVQTAGLLHDLGKIGIPEEILHKPAKLTQEEYEVVKKHAAIGEEILAEVRQLQDVARMVGEHHEYFNGSGYPKAKKGSEISLGGRIISVADALDTMLSDRPYSKARTLEASLTELNRCAGTQFDPDVVAAVHRLVETVGSEFFVNSSPVQPATRLFSEAASD